MNDNHSVFLEIQREIQTLTRKLAQYSKTNSQKMQEEWLRKDQALKVMGISSSTFKRLTSSGLLPYSRINRIIYVCSADIESLYKDHVIPKPFNKKQNESINYSSKSIF